MGLNFILHGECNVGKTSLRNRWVDGVFTGDVAPTFGVDFNIKTLDLVQEMEEETEEGAVAASSGAPDGTQPRVGGREEQSSKSAPCADVQVKINVYDTSGKPGYREVNSTYLLAFDAVLFVYDISSMSTLDVSHTQVLKGQPGIWRAFLMASCIQTWKGSFRKVHKSASHEPLSVSTTHDIFPQILLTLRTRSTFVPAPAMHVALFATTPTEHPPRGIDRTTCPFVPLLRPRRRS